MLLPITCSEELYSGQIDIFALIGTLTGIIEDRMTEGLQISFQLYEAIVSNAFIKTAFTLRFGKMPTSGSFLIEIVPYMLVIPRFSMTY